MVVKVTHGSPPSVSRAALVLLWAAVGVSAATTVVTFFLVLRMNVLFDSAVSEGRAYPFTGEVDELTFPPGVVIMSEFPMVLATLLLALLGGRRILYGRMGWRGLGGLALLFVLLWEPVPWFVVYWLGSAKYALYSYWYRPLLVITCVIYALCLLASPVLLARANSRKSVGR